MSKPSNLAIYLDDQKTIESQAEQQIQSLASELGLSFEKCKIVVHNLGEDFERVRRLFKLREEIRKSANITPTKSWNTERQSV